MLYVNRYTNVFKGMRDEDERRVAKRKENREALQAFAEQAAKAGRTVTMQEMTDFIMGTSGNEGDFWGYNPSEGVMRSVQMNAQIQADQVKQKMELDAFDLNARKIEAAKSALTSVYDGRKEDDQLVEAAANVLPGLDKSIFASVLPEIKQTKLLATTQEAQVYASQFPTAEEFNEAVASGRVKPTEDAKRATLSLLGNKKNERMNSLNEYVGRNSSLFINMPQDQASKLINEYAKGIGLNPTADEIQGLVQNSKALGEAEVGKKIADAEITATINAPITDAEYTQKRLSQAQRTVEDSDKVRKDARNLSRAFIDNLIKDKKVPLDVKSAIDSVAGYAAFGPQDQERIALILESKQDVITELANLRSEVAMRSGGMTAQDYDNRMRKLDSARAGIGLTGDIGNDVGSVFKTALNENLVDDSIGALADLYRAAVENKGTSRSAVSDSTYTEDREEAVSEIVGLLAISARDTLQILRESGVVQSSPEQTQAAIKSMIDGYRERLTSRVTDQRAADLFDAKAEKILAAAAIEIERNKMPSELVDEGIQNARNKLLGKVEREVLNENTIKVLEDKQATVPEKQRAAVKAMRDLGVDEYYIAIAGLESNFGANTNSGKSSAKGIWQVVDRTMDGLGMDDLREGTISEQVEIVKALAQQDAEYLKRTAGRPPQTYAERFILHNLGAPMGTNFLRQMAANPNITVDQILPAKVIENNEGLYVKASVGGVKQYATLAEAYQIIASKIASSVERSRSL